MAEEKTEKVEKTDAYARLSIREQLYLEARAMAEHALANGKKVPPNVIKTIESFTNVPCVTGCEENLKDLFNDKADIEGIVEIHNALVKIVAPAKPRTLLLLDMEQRENGFWKFLGAIALVRQMIMVAVLCLFLFILVGLSKDVNATGGHITADHGLSLLKNLVFYLSAAGLGASFAGLYKANSYIAEGTFDATHQASYWIRFLLGLIAGLIIAIVVSEQAFESAANSNPLFDQEILRPLMAMLGGFSADMVHTVLSRLVETVESLFRGSNKNVISAKIQEANTRLETNQAQQEVNIASKIMNTNGAINETTDPKEIKQMLNGLINDILPGAVSYIPK